MALRPAVIWRSVGGPPGPSEVRLESVWQSSGPSGSPPARRRTFCQRCRQRRLRRSEGREGVTRHGPRWHEQHWPNRLRPRGGFAEAPAAQRSSVVVRKSSRRALRPSGPGAHFSRVQIAGADAASARIAARAGPGALRRWRVFPGRRTRPGIAPATRNRSFQTLPPRWITLQTPQPNRLRPCRVLRPGARRGATKRAPATLPLRAEGSPAPGDQSTTTGGAATLPPRADVFDSKELAD